MTDSLLKFFSSMLTMEAAITKKYNIIIDEKWFDIPAEILYQLVSLNKRLVSGGTRGYWAMDFR